MSIYRPPFVYPPAGLRGPVFSPIRGQVMGGGVQTGGGLDADVVAYVAAVVAAGGSVSAARQLLLDTYVLGLKADGVWALLDVVQLFAAENATSALVDLKRRTTATLGGTAPVFTQDRQYAFDGTDDLVNLGYNPTSHAVAMTGSSMMISTYERTNVGVNAGYSAGGVDNSTTQGLRINPRTATSIMAGNANSANGVTTGGTITTSIGLSAIQRTAAPVFDFWKNGVQVEAFVPGTSGTVLPNETFLAGCHMGNGGTPTNFSARSISAVFAGAALTAAQHLALFTRTEAYLDAIGAGVIT